MHGKGRLCAVQQYDDEKGCLGFFEEVGWRSEKLCGSTLMNSTEFSGFIQASDEWLKLDLKRVGGTIIVLGETDSGKSTFVRWLVGELCRYHERVGWLDADVGQATLGVSTTMNLAVASKPAGKLPCPEASFFVGNTSPRGHMLPMLVGVQRLRGKALELGSTAVVVDTTGFVAPVAGGWTLKEWKIALLRPTVVIALQKVWELEHILKPLRNEGGLKLYVFPVAKMVRPRSPEERARRRRERFRDYFATAGLLKIQTTGLPLYGLGRSGPRRLVSLQDQEGFSLALGIVRTLCPDSLEILTPFAEADRIAGLRFGLPKIDPATGEEIGEG
jgi:polynucleotide 5'-hydroxyl-kinase GRC3/NOL9